MRRKVDQVEVKEIGGGQKLQGFHVEDSTQMYCSMKHSLASQAALGISSFTVLPRTLSLFLFQDSSQTRCTSRTGP